MIFSTVVKVAYKPSGFRVSWVGKSSRLPTLLLAERRRAWGVVELAEAAGIAPSYAVKLQIGRASCRERVYVLV